MGMARVFISYRRQEGEGHAGWIADGLRRRGHDVRTDVGTIRPGEDFVDAIRRSIAWCDALLVVIGPGWIDLRNQDGRRRLHADEDWVRFEIEEGLAAPEVKVIPVLIRDAQMPATAELPLEIAPFGHRHAQELSAKRWEYDTDQLSASITRQPLPPAAIAAACVGGALLLAIPGILAYEAVKELTVLEREHVLYIPRLALVWIVLWSLVVAGAAGATALALRRSMPDTLRSALKGFLAGAVAGGIGGAIAAALRTDGSVEWVEYVPAFTVLGLIAGAMVAPSAERAASSLGGAAGGALAGLVIILIEESQPAGLLGQPNTPQVIAVALVVGGSVAAAMVAHVGAPQYGQLVRAE